MLPGSRIGRLEKEPMPLYIKAIRASSCRWRLPLNLVWIDRKGSLDRKESCYQKNKSWAVQRRPRYVGYPWGEIFTGIEAPKCHRGVSMHSFFFCIVHTNTTLLAPWCFLIENESESRPWIFGFRLGNDNQGQVACFLTCGYQELDGNDIPRFGVLSS